MQGGFLLKLKRDSRVEDSKISSWNKPFFIIFFPGGKTMFWIEIFHLTIFSWHNRCPLAKERILPAVSSEEQRHLPGMLHYLGTGHIHQRADKEGYSPWIIFTDYFQHLIIPFCVFDFPSQKQTAIGRFHVQQWWVPSSSEPDFAGLSHLSPAGLNFRAILFRQGKLLMHQATTLKIILRKAFTEKKQSCIPRQLAKLLIYSKDRGQGIFKNTSLVWLFPSLAKSSKAGRRWLFSWSAWGFTFPRHLWKSHSSLSFGASSHSCSCLSIYRSPSFGVKFSPSMRMIQDYTQQAMPPGGKIKAQIHWRKAIHNWVNIQLWLWMR